MSKQILIIEPDHNTRVELRNILESQGHYVLSVTKGSDLLNFIETILTPDLILISSKLIFMDPQELVSLIRAREGYQDTPIIQITDVGGLMLTGVNAIITRPIDNSKLLEFIQE